MNVKDSKIVQSDESQNVSQPVDKSRRSFAKKGAAIAPVVMTLANRSAWAGGNHCSSHAAFLSYAANPAMSHGYATEIPEWKKPSEWYGDTGNLNAVINSVFPGQDKDSLISTLWPAGGFDGVTTVYVALSNTDLLGYNIASRLNLIVQPASVFDTLISLNDYDNYNTFYSSVCITTPP